MLLVRVIELPVLSVFPRYGGHHPDGRGRVPRGRMETEAHPHFDKSIRHADTYCAGHKQVVQAKGEAVIIALILGFGICSRLELVQMILFGIRSSFFGIL